MGKPQVCLDRIQDHLEERLSHTLGKTRGSLLPRIVLLGCAIVLVRWIITNIVRRVHGSRYILNGPTLIEERYADAHGEPFVIPTPSNRHVLVSSKKDIEELSEAPVDQLSLHAVAKEMLQPKYTMHGFEWKDQRGVEGTGFVRALRCLMTSQLPNLLPSLRCTLENEMTTELKQSRVVRGATQLKVFPSIKRVVAKTNSLFFFGDELSQNSDFTNAALQYPQDVFVAGEAVRSVPRFLASFAASLTTGRHQASKIMFEHLAQVVERRLEIRGHEGPDKPIDCMQYLIDTSPRKAPWSVQRTIGEIMAVWFSSVHQLAMAATFALEDLCLHPESVEPLRQELEENADGAAVLDLDAFPLLDSFLKESSRLSVSDAISVRRKALKEFDCFNGTHVNKGDWVCVAQRAIMHDSDHYPDPEAFDAFRFAGKRANGQRPESSRFTDAKPDWLIWGYGNTTCPGRFYASAVLRLLLCHILAKFDVRLLDQQATRTMTWRSAIVPCSNTTMVVCPRLEKTAGLRASPG